MKWEVFDSNESGINGWISDDHRWVVFIDHNQYGKFDLLRFNPGDYDNEAAWEEWYKTEQEPVFSATGGNAPAACKSKAKEIDRDVPIGYLNNAVGGLFFLCPTCDASDGQNRSSTPVFRINIGIYSQQCSKCKKLIVDGCKTARDNKSPLNLFSDGV